MDSRSTFLRSRGDQSVVRIRVVGRAIGSAQAFVAVAGEADPWKSHVGKTGPVLKLTQVGVAISLRRSRERS